VSWADQRERPGGSGAAERWTNAGPFALRLRLRLLKGVVPISRFLPCECVLPSFSGHRLLRAVGELQAPGTIGRRGSRLHAAPQDRYMARSHYHFEERSPTVMPTSVHQSVRSRLAAALSFQRSEMNETVRPLMEAPPPAR